LLTFSLGLTHLVGTPTLKPYMHGFFLSLKLYTTARLIANPTSYTEHRDRVVQERLAAKAESRIRARKDQPKVNKALAERLRKAEEREEAVERRKREKKGLPVEEPVEGGKKKATLMQDDRFKEIFENPDFEVDEESREFALINPATANNNVRFGVWSDKLTTRLRGRLQCKTRRMTVIDHQALGRARTRRWMIRTTQVMTVTVVKKEVSSLGRGEGAYLTRRSATIRPSKCQAE